MWYLAGTVFVLGALAPSVALWLWESASLGAATAASADVWRAALAYTAVDAIFVLSALIVLWIGVKYGNNRGKQGAAKVPAPYPGAWVEADGVQAVPQGFPFYLALAFVVTVIAPTAVLASCLLAHTPPAVTKALAAATLGPYLLVFVPQILLETRFLNRSFMTPVLPVLFAYYRFWQFIRSLGLIRSVAAAVAQQGRPSWLLHYLVSLMAFWAFDTACTIVWMPGMYEWQLQDVQLLTRLSQQRQHTVQQPTKAAASKQQVVPKCAEAVGGSSEQPAATLAAARVQHRWRLAGGHHRPADSGEFDYSFGY